MKKYILALLLGCPFLLLAQTVEQRIDSLLNAMTLQEKILQLHKEGGMNTQDNLRLNIPGFVMADGPHGVREGMATSFPVGISMAATWDTELAERVGIALGEEFRGKGKTQMLGPAMDMTRDPRNGRTPESGGEDPLLNALMNSALTKGVQKTPCIATIKHYNGKHKQTNRTNNNYFVTQRLLMEHYGLNFRKSVQDAGALSVMSAYNLINGFQAAENPNLLKTILRTNWGFPFYVVSDWNGIKTSIKAINAGNDICMGSDHYQNDLLNLVNSGLLPVSVIDDAVRNVLRTKIFSGMLDFQPAGKPEDVNSTAHQQLCYEAGLKSLVLLKNAGNILPLNRDTITKVAVIGPNAGIMQTDGTGSSWVTPFYSISPKQGIENLIGASKVLYAQGCTIGGNYTTDLTDALNKAAQAQAVIFCGGLDQSQEGEGLDRLNASIELPGVQKELINRLAQVNPNIIVVLVSGGITGMSGYINNAKAILQGFYPGQEGGKAIASVLFGDYNPSGKLPVTIPVNDAQLGSEITDFDFTNDYGCGYRWFDNKGYTPQFPFGFGLSYSNFTFSGLSLPVSSVPNGKNVSVSLNVTNTGVKDGTETVQLYISKPGVATQQDIKSLAAFRKVFVPAGQTKEVVFTLTPEDLYYYDETGMKYAVETGVYTLKAGNSSANLPLTGQFTIASAALKPDLQIASVYSIPRYPVIGNKVQFAATILNRGTSATPAGQIVTVNFLVNGVPVSKSVSLTTPIPAGGMKLIYGDVAEGSSFFWNASTTGEYSITATVNGSSSVEENYYDNNTLTSSFRVYTQPPVNLALRKTVYASSIEGTGLEGYHIVDGSLGTRWSSAFSDPQYIVISFGSMVSFNKIKIYWEAAYGKEYYVQTSTDSVNWTNIKYTNNGTGGIEEINNAVETRFLRLLLLRRGTVYGYSIYEIEVQNVSASSIEQKDDNNRNSGFIVYPNFPNPFSETTSFNYVVNRPADVSVKLVNSLGETLNYELLTNSKEGTNVYQFSPDKLNLSLSSGVYFFRFSNNNETLVRKVIFRK